MSKFSLEDLKLMNTDELWDNIYHISIIWIKLFIEKYSLLITQNNYDLLIFCGDSGQIMSKLVATYHSLMKTEAPEYIQLPIYRDAEVSHDQLIEFIRKCSLKARYTNILFVDDEIYKGSTLSKAIDLIHQSGKIDEETKISLIAEDQGFNINKFNYPVIFHSYASELDGLNNIISYCVPIHLQKQIREIYPDDEFNSKKMFCLLANLPIKNIKIGNPFWDFAFYEALKSHLPNLPELQNEFEFHLENMMKDIVRNL